MEDLYSNPPISELCMCSAYLVEHVKQADAYFSTNENDDDPLKKVRLLVLH